MSEKIKIFSQKMLDELKKRSEADPDMQKKLQGVTFSAILLATDCPGNEDRTLNIDVADGKFRELTMQVKPAPSDLRTAPFDQERYIIKIIGPYNVMGEALTGTPLLTLLDNMNIEGNIAKLMTKLGNVQDIIDTALLLPLEV